MRSLAVVTTVIVMALPENTGAWPTWGNGKIPDCTFAAAADWEMADLGYMPDEATIEREFYEAGGGAEGIEPRLWQSWWRHHGIGGIRVRLREVSGEDVLAADGPMLPWRAATRLARLLRHYHHLLAVMGWGGAHEIMLDGYTRAGPTYVTFGQERQMTWQEWRGSAWGLEVPSVIDNRDGLGIGRAGSRYPVAGGSSVGAAVAP